MKNYIYLLVLTIHFGCAKESGFYGSEMRSKMRNHNANYLYTNYKIAECDKYVLLKTNTAEGEEKEQYEVTLNFLKGEKFELSDRSILIKDVHQSLTLTEKDINLTDQQLKFRLLDKELEFPKINHIKVLNHEQLKELGAGTKIKWEPVDSSTQIMITIRPGHQYCGKKGQKGQIYGNRPFLVSDTGEYIIKENDLNFLDSEMDASILLKRGENQIEKISTEKGGSETVCISSISYTIIESKIR